MQRQLERKSEMREAGKVQPALFAELTELRCCNDSEFENGFSAFIAHLKKEFFIKEQMMEDETSDMRRRVKKTHEELLMLLQHAEARALLKDLHLGRKIVDMLPHWYVRHCFV